MTDHEITVSRSFLSEIAPLSEPSFSVMEQMFRYKKLKEGETFIRVNQPNTSEYVLLNGFCRSYLHNPEKEEVTLSFFRGPTVLSPHITRTRGDVSNMNYQALTSVDLALFDAHDFVKLMIENLEVRNFANTILKNELMQKIEREIALATLSAKERLLQFRKQYAILENLIPHPLIASYLGITPISLSRLRGELTGK